MATDRANDLRAFSAFAGGMLSEGGSDLTLDEALARWEYETQSGEDREATHQAIRQGLADVDSGRVRSFEDFDRAFRQAQGLPSRATHW